MNKTEHYLYAIQKFRTNLNIKGTVDAEVVAKKLGMSTNELVFVLINQFAYLYDENYRLNKENEDLKERNRIVESSLNEYYTNPSHRQATLVKNGLKVKKDKMTLIELEGFMNLGYTDKEIMDYFNISKSTFFRRKKELREKQEQKKQQKGRK